MSFSAKGFAFARMPFIEGRRGRNWLLRRQSLLRDAFLCAPAGAAILKSPFSKGDLGGLSMSFSAKGLLFARMPFIEGQRGRNWPH